jgi:membrane protein DedA with SNARE-associated domain
MTQAWLVEWGYLAIVVGAFVEGEATLIAAGALAQQRILILPLVVISGSLGSLAWSQLWFRTGRHAGRALLDRYPHWQAHAARVQRGLARYASVYLLLSRFIIGMGTASPALIGATGFPPRRFLAWDVIGALGWSAALCCSGWAFSTGVNALWFFARGEA